ICGDGSVTLLQTSPLCGGAKQASPKHGGSKIPHSQAPFLECASLLAPSIAAATVSSNLSQITQSEILIKLSSRWSIAERSKLRKTKAAGKLARRCDHQDIPGCTRCNLNVFGVSSIPFQGVSLQYQ